MLLSTQNSFLRGMFGDFEAVDILKNAGYDNIDLSMFHMSRPGSPFNEPDWEEYVNKLKAYSDEKGVVYNQSHIPFTFDWAKEGEWESTIKDTQYRALDICGIMGVKYVVVHPIHHMVYPGHEQEIYDINMRYYSSLIPFCEKYGYKIAIENMWQREQKTKRICHDTCSRMEELIRYIDGLGGTQHFVACLDIGHTSLVGLEPQDCIRELGHKYLHSLHVHDNDYTGDQHLLPGQGLMNWDEVCRALADIDYDGELTYEADNFLKRFSKDMMPLAVKFMNDIGNHLCDKIEKYKAESAK